MGALCSTALALVFPPLIQLVLACGTPDGPSAFLIAKNAFILVFSIFGFVTGTYESISSLIHVLLKEWNFVGYFLSCHQSTVIICVKIFKLNVHNICMQRRSEQKKTNGFPSNKNILPLTNDVGLFFVYFISPIECNVKVLIAISDECINHRASQKMFFLILSFLSYSFTHSSCADNYYYWHRADVFRWITLWAL